ncbi:DMT family transporter [Pseudobacteriovorax antillogorgiicola]|uniref:EamA-like transporter family protein n=1 Tax=Pseudobacteriovorax antillogorgiicola TaxID=1513793 RepID=A0A1Y6BTA4_9BACT|nr:DMT family transporter [Pseudobacteriovorax antillogorgiicola]TCS53077.1 EamA-like transporter family protein [Pseudobacteriovorax antillogorgiicola]SMF26155.1 EamA-like transporter family protein [Pseudobacteriovorax antillogorgiicola]
MESIPYLGEAASLLSAMIWAVSMTFFTAYSKQLRPDQLNLFKHVIASLFLCLGVLIINPPWPEAPEVYLAFFLSGFVGLTLGDTALFAALSRLGAQNTSVSQCAVPPLTAILAFTFLQESLTFWEMLGMAITVIAVFLILSHRSSRSHFTLSKRQLVEGLFFAGVAALGQSSAVVIIRHYLQGTDVILGTTLRILPSLLILLAVTGYKGQLRSLLRFLKANPRGAITLSGVSFMGTFLGLLLMSLGAKYAKAGISSALTSTFPIWIIPVSAVVLKEPVSLRKTVWTVVAVAGIGVMLV